MTLRQQFDESLAQIKNQVLEMGAVTLDMLHEAVHAVVQGDHSAVDRMASREREIDKSEQVVLHDCVRLLVQEGPVASDLRLIVTTLGVVGEIESTADIALKLAGCVNKIGSAFPGEMRLPFQRMGELARQVFSLAMQLYSDYRPEMLEEIVAIESEIDQAYAESRNELLQMIRREPQLSEPLMRTIDAFHKLEHVGDRAHEIAGRLRTSHQPA